MFEKKHKFVFTTVVFPFISSLLCHPVFILCLFFIFTTCKPACPKEGGCLKVHGGFLHWAALVINHSLTTLQGFF